MFPLQRGKEKKETLRKALGTVFLSGENSLSLSLLILHEPEQTGPGRQ